MLGGGAVMRRAGAGWIGLLIVVFGCGSSSAEPIDPVATAYCVDAMCSEFANCERVVSETIRVACTEENRAYYACVTEASCDTTACEAEFAARTLCLGRAPRDRVGVLIFSRRPSANLGHRGTGVNAPENPFAENSISSFVAAMEEGADGIKLNVEITNDGKIIVMYDDMLDETTDCTGCVSALDFDDIRTCRLKNGKGELTDEPPPTLLEAYSAVRSPALINVELKVFGEDCLTPMTGPEQLVPAVLEEVTLIGGENRTIFSSFDETAVELVKMQRPGYYSALLSDPTGPQQVQRAVDLNQDSIHPRYLSTAPGTIEDALAAGLQVTVWTVNTADEMEAEIEKGATAIITDEPDILAEVLEKLSAP
jgi:glycerophosphoryl diester phosphodiesterase